MAKRAGAYVFATVSTDEKAQLATEAGADRVIIYTREDFEEEVKKGTRGAGVEVVYDAVGETTFDKSLSSLTDRGCLALYGAARRPGPSRRVEETGLQVPDPALAQGLYGDPGGAGLAGRVKCWAGSGRGR